MRVTKDSNTLITLDGIRFNDGDSNYARCTLASVNPGDTAYFTLNPFCGDFLFEQVLGGNGMIELFDVEKSAAGQGIFADFRLAANTHVKLEVFNERGELLNVAFEADLSGGGYIVPLTLANEGAFFLSLNADSEILIRKLALIR